MPSLWQRIAGFFGQEEEIPDEPVAGSSPQFGEVAYADPFRLLPIKGVWAQFNPSELVSRKGLAIYDKMRRDDQIKACMSLKKGATLSTGWTIKSPEGKDANEPNSDEGKWEVTEFCEWALREGMSNTLEDSLLEVMTSLDYGFSFVEKVWDTVTPDKDQTWAGKVFLKALKGKKPHSIYFKADEFGNLVEVHQQKPTGTGVWEALPIEKFIIYSNEMEWGNFYGRSDLEAAYRPWFVKNEAYKYLGVYLERASVPPLIAYINPNTSPKDMQADIKNILKNLQNGTVMIVPRKSKDDAEITPLPMQGNVEDMFKPAFDMLNLDIARALLMPGLIGVTPSQSQGSFARAKVDFDVFMITVEKLRRDMARQIVNEQIIKPLVIFNFGPQEEYPCFEFLPMGDDLKKDIFDIWEKMVSGKIVTPQKTDEEHIRQVLQFPDRQEGDEKEMPAPPVIDPLTGKPLPPDPMDENQPGGSANNINEPKPPKGKEPPGDAIEEKDFHTFRQKNKYERAVNFEQIASDLDGFEASAKKDLAASLAASRDALLKRVAKGQFGAAKKITALAGLPGMAAFRKSIKEHLQEVYAAGSKSLRQDVKAQVKKYDQQPNYIPRDAIVYLNAKGIDITATVDSDLLSDVKQVLSNSLKYGWTLEETQEKLADVFEPYIGDDTVIRDGDVIEPYRLETIIRTESTAAYNQGRLVMGRDPDLEGTIQGWQYSAVMDGRTTEICTSLDGKIFTPGDPNLDRLTPPNHYNCRSILVPITIATTIDENDFITAKQAGAAIDLAGDFA